MTAFGPDRLDVAPRSTTGGLTAEELRFILWGDPDRFPELGRFEKACRFAVAPRKLKAHRPGQFGSILNSLRWVAPQAGFGNAGSTDVI